MSYLGVAQVISTRGRSKQVDGVFKARLSYPLKTQGVWGGGGRPNYLNRTALGGGHFYSMACHTVFKQTLQLITWRTLASATKQYIEAEGL